MRSEILIRSAEKTDIQDLTEMQLGQNFISGTLQLPYPSQELWRNRLENQPEGMYNLVAVIDDKVVGHLGLHTNNRPRRKHVGSFGIGINDTYAGRGVGSALLSACVDMADNWLNLVRIEIEVFHDNRRAIDLYARFGFVEEGRFKHYAFRNGEYVDTIAMARIRPGFEHG